jgi:hypothetical protein
VKLGVPAVATASLGGMTHGSGSAGAKNNILGLE